MVIKTWHEIRASVRICVLIYENLDCCGHYFSYVWIGRCTPSFHMRWEVFIFVFITNLLLDCKCIDYQNFTKWIKRFDYGWPWDVCHAHRLDQAWNYGLCLDICFFSACLACLPLWKENLHLTACTECPLIITWSYLY